MDNKNIEKQNKHQFAFYYHDLSSFISKNIDIIITSDELYHRLKHVVRIKTDDRCILFNQKEHAIFTFGSFQGKNKIIGTLVDRQLNVQLKPEITFFLPLLKLDALSQAVYALAEVGITTIQLVTTAKTQTPCNNKLIDKLYKVAVSAAEQSKMFAFPTILPALSLDACLKQSGSKVNRFYFDVDGVSSAVWYKSVLQDQNYYLLVGPEGDLTKAEKNAVKQAGFQICLLTPTVLRSVRSISLVSGMFRL